jgi:hypothetical protein
MSDDDWLDAWMNPGGPAPEPDPDDPMWLTPTTGWAWDVDSLLMGEYVGYPLYLRVRDRLQSLRVPTQAHNRIIQELVDTHDVSALDHGEARSTLVVWDVDKHVVPMEILDSSEFAALTGTAAEEGE